MAFYLTKAEREQIVADELFDMLKDLPEARQKRGAELIARLVNAGIKCVPRSAQSTVRLNIIRKVTENLPIECSLVDRKQDNDPTKTYKALVVQ